MQSNVDLREDPASLISLYADTMPRLDPVRRRQAVESLPRPGAMARRILRPYARPHPGINGIRHVVMRRFNQQIGRDLTWVHSQLLDTDAQQARNHLAQSVPTRPRIE